MERTLEKVLYAEDLYDCIRTKLDQIYTALHAFQQPLHEGEITVFNSNFTECKTTCDGKDGNGGGCIGNRDKGAVYRKWNAVAQVL